MNWLQKYNKKHMKKKIINTFVLIWSLSIAAPVAKSCQRGRCPQVLRQDDWRSRSRMLLSHPVPFSAGNNVLWGQLACRWYPTKKKVRQASNRHGSRRRRRHHLVWWTASVTDVETDTFEPTEGTGNHYRRRCQSMFAAQSYVEFSRYENFYYLNISIHIYYLFCLFLGIYIFLIFNRVTVCSCIIKLAHSIWHESIISTKIHPLVCLHRLSTAIWCSWRRWATTRFLNRTTFFRQPARTWKECHRWYRCCCRGKETMTKQGARKYR